MHVIQDSRPDLSPTSRVCYYALYFHTHAFAPGVCGRWRGRPGIGSHWRSSLFQSFKAPAERLPRVPGRVLWGLFIPSIFDLIGTNLAQIGLLYTTVSYYQLLRCTVIVVTALLKVYT